VREAKEKRKEGKKGKGRTQHSTTTGKKVVRVRA
jgi:hypothetical protein